MRNVKTARLLAAQGDRRLGRSGGIWQVLNRPFKGSHHFSSNHLELCHDHELNTPLHRGHIRVELVQRDKQPEQPIRTRRSSLDGRSRNLLKLVHCASSHLPRELDWIKCDVHVHDLPSPKLNELTKSDLDAPAGRQELAVTTNIEPSSVSAVTHDETLVHRIGQFR